MDKDPRKEYADIIDLPYRRSARHRPMPLSGRAAQFAPFAALSGYEDMITEESRLTERKIRPDEDELARLNRQMAKLIDSLKEGNHPSAAVTFFVPDKHKSGGEYKTLTGSLGKYDEAAGTLVFYGRNKNSPGVIIPIREIIEIREN